VDQVSVVVGRARVEDWAEVRAVRLLALGTDPDAFGSTVERERAFDDDVWRARVAAGRTFLARVADVVVGTVAYHAEAGEPLERHLVGLWVAPEARGRGVADVLVRAAKDAAAAEGARVMTLCVIDDNDRARRFYERAGFRLAEGPGSAPGVTASGLRWYDTPLG
jgi:GNAT superfamily N-acetyltransferase